VIDEDSPTPTREPVPHHPGRSEEYDILKAYHRRFDRISRTLLEVADRVEQLEEADRKATIATIDERLDGIGRALLGPGYAGRDGEGPESGRVGLLHTALAVLGGALTAGSLAIPGTPYGTVMAIVGGACMTASRTDKIKRAFRRGRQP
jgi:hypothetical protein